MAALAVVLALAACGGGGGDEGGSPAREGASKEDFVAQADAICAAANEKREALASPRLSIEYPRVIAAYAARLEPVYADALTKLKALEVPPGDKETVEEMIAKFEEAFTWIDDVVAAGRARPAETLRLQKADARWGELAREAQNTAFAYGLKECARFGTP